MEVELANTAYQLLSKGFPYIPKEVTAQSAVLSIIWYISLAIALIYVWREGYLMEFLLYILSLLGRVVGGLLLALIVFFLLIWIPPVAFFAALGVLVAVVVLYRAKLAGSLAIGLLWTVALFIGAIIGPLVDAWFYVHYAAGEY
jgi:hypothetical protein